MEVRSHLHTDMWVMPHLHTDMWVMSHLHIDDKWVMWHLSCWWCMARKDMRVVWVMSHLHILHKCNVTLTYSRQVSDVTHAHTHTHTHTHTSESMTAQGKRHVSHVTTTGWRRLIWSPKIQIIFHKRATKYKSLLQKMTYKDKGSHESSPPCTCDRHMTHVSCCHELVVPPRTRVRGFTRWVMSHLHMIDTWHVWVISNLHILHKCVTWHPHSVNKRVMWLPSQ